MTKKFTLLFLIGLTTFVTNAQEKTNSSFRLFFLGGQSNMTGYGYNESLPDNLNKTFENVWIFEGNPAPDEKNNGGMGIWEPLKPGHGTGFKSDGTKNQLSNRFGIELSFAKKMQELFPNDKIAIIKYAKGGSSLDSIAARNFGSWEPDFIGKNGINQYDHFLNTLKNALSKTDIDQDGIRDELVPSGILWMQGESDAITEKIANRYYSNLKRIIDLFRASLLSDDLPVVIGKISDSWNNETGKVWTYGELVQAAQEKFVLSDVNAAIVRDTRYFKYSDPWHYDSNGYVVFGEKFAEKMAKLLNKN